MNETVIVGPTGKNEPLSPFVMGCNVMGPVYGPLNVIVPPPLQLMSMDIVTDCEEVVLVVGLLCGWGAADAPGVHISAAIISTMLVSSDTLHALHRKRVIRRSARARCGLSRLLCCRGPVIAPPCTDSGRLRLRTQKTTGLHNCWPVAPLARHERRCPNTRPWVIAAIARLLMAGTSPTCGVRVYERQRHKKPAARIAGRLHHWLGADSGAQVPSARHRRHQYAVVGIVAVWQVRHYREQPAAFRD